MTVQQAIPHALATNTPALLHTSEPPNEEDTRPAHADAPYRALLEKLSRASVAKHFDAFVDIPWDDPDFQIRSGDLRWQLREGDTLAETAWYRALPEHDKARLGLYMAAMLMKHGAQFESVLKRGLLEFAITLPNRSPEFRYVYHEVIEEAQHSLMFQEFVDRSGFDIRGLPRRVIHGSRLVVALGRRFPELFFFFVLGGEDPIDYQQRTYVLSGEAGGHPLLRRVSQLHVMEEARHISFARAYLRNRVPRLRGGRLWLLKILTPLLLSQMTRHMMRPSPEMIREFNIPQSALREAYDESSKYRDAVHAALAKVATLAADLGLRDGRWNTRWQALGLVP